MQNKTKNIRILEFGLIQWIAFLPLIVSSIYYLLNGTPQYAENFRNFLIINGLISEFGAIALLIYVLFRQERNVFDLGFLFRKKDLLASVCLMILGSLATYISWLLIFFVNHSFNGDSLQVSHVITILDGSINVSIVLFVLLNPFFEELIVRAYTISEIEFLTNSKSCAVALSVFIQFLYHLYQSLPHALSIVGVSLIFSLYYVKYRRILPVILAHGFFDVYALFFYAAR
jgi:membrane protease YdiL (CAAX protease family)